MVILCNRLHIVSSFGVLECIFNETDGDYQIMDRTLTANANMSPWVRTDGCSLRSFFPGDLGKQLVEWLTEAERVENQYTIGIRHLSGEEGLFHLRLDPLADRRMLLQLVEHSAQQAERRRLSEDRVLLQRLIDADPNRIFLKDSSGSYLLVNRAAAEFFNTTPEEMLGRTDHELLDSLEQIRQESPELLPSAAPVVQTRERIFVPEEPMITPGGEQRWFRTVKVPMDDTGYPGCSLEIGVDITDEARTRKQLEEQVQFQQILLDTVPIPIYYQDHANIYRGCNQAFLELTGLKVDQLLGRSVDEVWSGDQADEYRRQNERIYTQHTRQAEGRREKMPDGRVRDLLVVKAIYPDSEGKPAGIIGAVLDLTEQKQIQTALQVSENRYRRILEESVLGIFMADFDGELKEINSALVEMFGYSDKNEALKGITNIGRSILFPSTTVLRALQERLLSGEPVVFEGEYARKDGSQFSGRTHLWIVREPVNEEVFVEGMIEDVTEQRAAEHALAASEERFRTLYESVQVGVLVQRADGTIVHANQQAAEIMNLPVDEISSRTSVHPDWQMVLEDGTPVQGDEHPSMLTLKTGIAYRGVIRGLFGGQEERTRWLMINTTPVFVEQTDEIKEVIITISDVTELKKTRDHLMESERRLSTLMGNLPGMAYRCRNDPAWTMVFVSQGCLGLTGYTAEDLIGNRKLGYADMIHPDDREMVWEAVQQGIEDNRQYQMEYRIRSFGGGERWVWEQGCLVDEENGGFLEGFIIDISQRKQAEEEVAHINRDLEERVRKRTAEVEAANDDLRRFARLAAGREIRMAELKQEIQDLRAGMMEAASGGERGGE